MTKSDRRIIELSAAYALTCIAIARDGAIAQPARWLLVEQASEALETIEAVADASRDAFVPPMMFSMTGPSTQAASPLAACSRRHLLPPVKLFQAA